MNQPRIAVVCGGSSTEAEVSRSSGRCVADALKATYESVELLELDTRLPAALVSAKIDVVFPVLHGPPGEDGTIQGMLEIMGIPYVGSGVKSSACCVDKALAKLLLKEAHLPVAKDVVVFRNQAQGAVDRVIETLGLDVVVKPASQGSALGVTFASNRSEISSALEAAFAVDDCVLVEQRITGKEITVGILERDGLEAFPVIEVRTPENTWYDFEHRYTPGQSEHVIPAEIKDEQYEMCQSLARDVFRVLGCRDLGRVDFVVPDSGSPIILELNNLPGMTPTSLYPDGANSYGIPFEKLVSILVERALSRKGER